ncbi:MAG: class F sortase [Actinomycetota bacterium]
MHPSVEGRRWLLVAVVLGGFLLAACGADPLNAVAPAPPGAEGGGSTESGNDGAGPGPIALSSTIDLAEDGIERTSGVPIAVDAVPVSSARFEDLELPRRPASLRIDAIGVEAPIITAGVADNGEMELPGAEEAAWYKHGPMPGDDLGSSVIAAHVDWAGAPGPFFQLLDLPIGSIVTVVMDDGSEHRYRTVDTSQYTKEDLPIEELFRREGEHALALVTCGGDFDAGERSYSDNVVTIAVPLGPTA